MTLDRSWIVAALLLTGCDAGAQSAGANMADALAQVRAKVEGQRQCAALLDGNYPMNYSADALSGPKVDALVAAGLIRREPAPPSPGDPRPRATAKLTPAGMRDAWVQRLDPGKPADAWLCFGRKHVTAVRAEAGDAGSEVGGSQPGSVLRYDYRIVDAPAWTARPDIRQAFPFLTQALSKTHTSEQIATREGDAWVLTGDTGRDATAELPSEAGFFPS
jgi:hypothetical protein